MLKGKRRLISDNALDQTAGAVGLLVRLISDVPKPIAANFASPTNRATGVNRAPYRECALCLHSGRPCFLQQPAASSTNEPSFSRKRCLAVLGGFFNQSHIKPF